MLSIIHQVKLVADIQTSASLRSRNPSTEDGLLFFYKHLGQTLTRQRLLHGDRAGWMRLRVILLFFSAPFSDDDVDLILGSGMLSVLARFIQRADKALGSAGADSVAAFDDDELSAIFRYKSWAWQIFLHLSTFLLSQPQSSRSKHHKYLLAATVGQQLTIQLQQSLSRLRRLAENRGQTAMGQLLGTRTTASAFCICGGLHCSGRRWRWRRRRLRLREALAALSSR